MDIQAPAPSITQKPEPHRPPLLLFGDNAMAEAHDLLGELLLTGERAVILDGANRFDAYRLAALAQAARRNPREVLPRARVSRATSWQQWLVLLEAKAGPEAARAGARYVFALGPLDLLTDNDLKEPGPAARRVAEALGRLSRSGFRVVCAQKPRRLQEAKREFLLEPFRRVCRIVNSGQLSADSVQPEGKRAGQNPLLADS